MKEKIKKLFEENKKIVWAFLAILLTIGLNMKIDCFMDKILFNGNQMVWLMLCVFIYFVLKKSNEYKEKRLFICSIILGVLLAFFQTITQITFDYWSLNEVVFTTSVTIYFIVKMLTYGTIFANIIKIVIKWLENKKWEKSKKKDIFKPTLKTFLIIAAIFFIAWLPYFLNYYPGTTSYDTNYQLMQGYGIYPYSNHHPIIHTMIITIITKIGYAITNSYNFGIAIYVILQMIVCAAAFSLVIYYMAKKKIPFCFKLIAFLFFAFHPIVPQFSIAVWKDVPFSLFLILFIIGIIELITNEENFIKNYKWNILFVFSILGTVFFRNNGIYVVVLTFPFVIIAKRKYWKKIAVMFVVPIIIYMIVTGPVFKVLGIGKSSDKEMLSIPIQQMAKISICKKDELTEDEKERIAMYIPIEKTEELYRPNISDPMKNEFNEQAYAENKVAFLKLYFKLALRFPLETIESFIANTYGYYCPDTVTFPLATGTYEKTEEKEKFMVIETDPIIKIPLIDKIVDAIYDKEIPIVSLIANIGFAFWIILVLLVYCIYEKKYYNILMYIPIAVLYLTCLASPVSGELRYIYGMFISLPLFLGFTLQKS